MADTSEHSAEIDGQPVFWLDAPAPDGEQPPPLLYLHGVPNSADEWLPFLRRSGGIAPDLPGFGRSVKVADYDYSIAGYDRFLERFTEMLGLERVSLVMHDWGSVGLAFAQRYPERIERLVIIDAVPLLPGYRWHRVARVWRTPVLGELFMGAATPAMLRLFSREWLQAPGPAPALAEEIDRYFDNGTQRAILKLYRASPPSVLAAAGADLARITAPALVVWGDRDPYVPTRFADAYRDALPNAQLVTFPDARHWPWLDRPELLERIAEFLAA